MNLNTFINRFFGRDDSETSKNMAKERLRLVLVHDRLDVSEQMMNALRVDLINVIGKYFGIDEQALEVSLSRETSGMALLANIPIHRQAMADEPAADTAPQQTGPEQGTLFG
jgi:cell division topological specificity factor